MVAEFVFVARARLRLDRAVAEAAIAAFPGEIASRSQVQRWIDAGRVTVDGVPGRAAHKVNVGATVRVDPLPPELSSAAPDGSVTFHVVFEDAHLIVIDKPAGLVVHPAKGHPTGTLVNGLLARGGFDAVGEPGDPLGHLRPGIVHRLDRGTSGVMVVAKSARAREGLKALFALHDIERSYLAITVGATTEADIATLHGRHPTDRLRFSTRVTEGRRAITHVSPITSLLDGKATLVRCTLETGRTHQIRVHLSEIARTPVLGDPLYGSKPRDPLLRELGVQLGRQALHANVLGFVHPITGEPVRFESELPPELRSVLAQLS